MAAETSTTIDIFGLTEWNEMIKIASAVPPAPVGGTIFCIDDTADGEYQFFDANGSVIENVQIGDKPYAYKVVTPGTKDKYYVYHDEVYDNLRWTYYKDGAYVYEPLSTSSNIGSGKTNTEIAMTRDNGAYITNDSNGLPTIWYQLQQARLAKVGGCDDWFVPSKRESDSLRSAIVYERITGGIIAGSFYKESIFNNKPLWSSSEDSAQNVFYYYRDWVDNGNKGSDYSIFFIRAF